MRLHLQFQSLRETTPMEYAKRFLFGGIVTLTATLIADHYGPIIGGLFLAFPGIFPGGISLVEKHKIERERDAGKQGIRSARGEAAVEATGPPSEPSASQPSPSPCGKAWHPATPSSLSSSAPGQPGQPPPGQAGGSGRRCSY